jgi:hypothetical protein
MATELDRLNSASRKGDWLELERLARVWLANQKFFVPHMFLIQALLQTGRSEEADTEFDELISYKFNIADYLSAFPAIARRYKDRMSAHYVVNTMRTTHSIEGPHVPRGVVRWDVDYMTRTREDFLAQASAVFDAALPPQPAFDRANASICTFGSCFAANLARIMVEQKMQATSLLIEESVNSTYANKILMEIVAGVGESQAHADMRETFGAPFFETVRSKIEAATHIVLTVGVAPSFFRNDDNTFVFAKNYRDLLEKGEIHMRTTSFSENAENLACILALMDQVAPEARKIVTVSPVPLSATAEMSSVVVADCVSKSTLRAVVHETVRANPSLTYFPAFEIVRWLSGYTGTEVYGADDQNSRHVSNWVVEFIVSSFIQRFFSPNQLAERP